MVKVIIKCSINCWLQRCIEAIGMMIEVVVILTENLSQFSLRCSSAITWTVCIATEFIESYLKFNLAWIILYNIQHTGLALQTV